MGRGRPIGSASPPHSSLEAEPGGWDVNYPFHPDRCGTCGRVGELLTFRLWSVKYRKWAGHYRLCHACWRRSNERPDPDPLTLQAVAG